MNNLINYLKSHKYFRVKDIEKHYLTDSVKDNLVKNNLTLQELCYRIRNDIPLDKIFICRYCGKKIKFQFNKYNTFCNNKCANNFKNKQADFIDKIKFKKALHTDEDKQKILQKSKKTCLKKYGVPFINQSSIVKEKRKNTMIKRYGVSHFSNSKEFSSRVSKIQQKIRASCLEKYGVDNFAKTKEFQEKTYNTKKVNGTSSTSYPEKRSLDLLRERFKDVKDHYKSDKYPFECDAYIPELDLYIEFNYHWTHGEEPFDKENLEHQKILSKWSQKVNEVNFKGKKKNYFKTAMQVWTERDPKKVKISKENNIKLLSFYKEKDFKEWLKVGV